MSDSEEILADQAGESPNFIAEKPSTPAQPASPLRKQQLKKPADLLTPPSSSATPAGSPS